jgi:hypothetical protein
MGMFISIRKPPKRKNKGVRISSLRKAAFAMKGVTM